MTTGALVLAWLGPAATAIAVTGAVSRAGAGALACAAGTMVGLWALGVPVRAPLEGIDWLWGAAAAGALLGWAPARIARIGWLVTWPALVAGVLWAPLGAWDPPRAAATFAIAAAAGWVGGLSARRDPSAPAVLVGIAGGLAATLAASGSLRLGLLGGALTAALAGATLASARWPERAGSAGLAAVPPLVVLALIGAVYSSTPPLVAAWFAVAPLVAARRVSLGAGLALGALAGLLGAAPVLAAFDPPG
ncbi:MAG: hypothetical protein ABMA64_21795 [Myxococcota bacterium]